MLVALNQNKERKIAWETEKEEEPFLCLDCNEKVILKKGKVKIHHFAHTPDINCEYGKGKGIEHITAQKVIYDELKNQGIKVELEYKINKRRADVYYEFNDKKYVVELQKSGIKLEELSQRIIDYCNYDCEILWVLFKQFDKIKGWKFILSRFYEGFLYYYIDKIHLHGVIYDKYGMELNEIITNILKNDLYKNRYSLCYNQCVSYRETDLYKVYLKENPEELINFEQEEKYEEYLYTLEDYYIKKEGEKIRQLQYAEEIRRGEEREKLKREKEDNEKKIREEQFLKQLKEDNIKCEARWQRERERKQKEQEEELKYIEECRIKKELKRQHKEEEKHTERRFNGQNISTFYENMINLWLSCQEQTNTDYWQERMRNKCVIHLQSINLEV